MCFKHEPNACSQGLNFFLLWLIGLDYEDCFRKILSFSNKAIILKVLSVLKPVGKCTKTVLLEKTTSINKLICQCSHLHI